MKISLLFQPLSYYYKKKAIRGAAANINIKEFTIITQLLQLSPLQIHKGVLCIVVPHMLKFQKIKI